jgi:hypothetical protein
MLKTTLFLSFVTMSSAQAGDLSAISGLYFPSMDQGVLQWNCTSDTIGMDGGALSITETSFQGVDNTCDIQDPRPEGASINATLVCMAEGMPWENRVRFTPTPTGVQITDDRGTVSWTRCGS